jgi:hypothetical protein
VSAPVKFGSWGQPRVQSQFPRSRHPLEKLWKRFGGITGERGDTRVVGYCQRVVACLLLVGCWGFVIAGSVAGSVALLQAVISKQPDSTSHQEAKCKARARGALLSRYPWVEGLGFSNGYIHNFQAQPARTQQPISYQPATNQQSTSNRTTNRPLSNRPATSCAWCAFVSVRVG